MVIVFEKHYVRALLINVENELTKIVGLPFVDGKFAASVLPVHDYSNVVTKGRRWINTTAAANCNCAISDYLLVGCPCLRVDTTSKPEWSVKLYGSLTTPERPDRAAAISDPHSGSRGPSPAPCQRQSRSR
jgi:hypothetical protein